jgi:hypothetical protein
MSLRPSLRPFGFALLAAFAVGCRRPPEAPDKLEELCVYLFEHIDDEDTEALDAGLTSLDTWLDGRMAETSEGYTIDNLTEVTIREETNRKVSNEGLVGAAVGGTMGHSVRAVAIATVKDDPEKMYPDTYSKYDRRYNTNLDCFVQEECDFLEAESSTVSQYPLGLEVSVDILAQYRWVEMESGTAMVYRTWMTEPAEVSLDWLGVPAQFYLTANIPRGKGRTTRLQATWIIAEINGGSVPESVALDMVVDSMQGSEEELEAWLDSK